MSVLRGRRDRDVRGRGQLSHRPRARRASRVADLSGDGRPRRRHANTAGSYPNCCNPAGTRSASRRIGYRDLGAASPFTVGQTPFAVADRRSRRRRRPRRRDGNWHSNNVTRAHRTSRTSGGDTTPPTITARTPAPGATGVALDVSPTATFSEAMNPATLTTSTFTLVQQGQTTPLAASVSYAGQIATLDPSANLPATTTYTATVKGGASGPRTSPATRSPPTSAGASRRRRPERPRPTSRDLTWTSATNGWGPVEKDESNGDAGRRRRRHPDPERHDLREGPRRARRLGRALRRLATAPASRPRSASTTRSGARTARSSSRCTRARPRSTTRA